MEPQVTERAAAVAALLREYDRVLLMADHAPAVMWVRTRPPRPDMRLDVWWLPRLTVLLRFFVRVQVRHGVQALRRRLSAEHALGGSACPIAEEHEAVVRYEDAIPPTHGRALALGFVAAVLVIGRLAVQYAGQVLSSVPALTHVQRTDIRSSSGAAERAIAFSGEAEQLMRRLGESLTDSVPSPAKVIDALLSARLADVAVVAAASSFAVYAVLRPCVPAFRLKRMLFNVEADPVALRASTARWHVSRRTGVYALEERVFHQLGTRPPRELPFDLLASALLCVIPLALGTYLLTRSRFQAVWVGFVVFDLTLATGMLLLFIGSIRIAWLIGIWRRRHGGDVALRPPYDVLLPNGRRVIVRDPLAVALIVFLIPQVFLVWLVGIVHELRSVARADKDEDAPIRLGIPRPASLRHSLTAVAFAAVAGWLLLQIPVLPVTFLIPWHIAQAWPPGSWWPPWLYWTILALTGPPVVALAQATANRLWKRAGTPVREGPVAPP